MGAEVTGKVRVFTENDVRRLLDQLQVPDDFGDLLDGFKSELTEEVVARSHADRLVTLALVWGAWDYEGVPIDASGWLFDEGMLATAGDQSGERWPVLTPKGEAWFREQLERDRS